jgi:large subunit ribosomal protein L22
MEKTFYFKNLPISPKKLRFLLPELKKISPVSSLEYLEYLPKKGAKILKKAVKNAIDAAKSSLKINENELKFKTLAVDEGRKLKRYRPGGRGTVKPIVRRFAHLKIVLAAKEDEIKQKEKPLVEKNKKKEEKAEKKLKIKKNNQ